MKHIAIIYHDADFDGILSNEVCRHWLKKLHPGAEIHSYGWDYGRPTPQVIAENDELCDAWVNYDTIYIVDLSVDELMARPELRDKIVWIDHHKSAIEKWDATPSDADPCPDKFIGYRIDGVAACRLCWQWFASPTGPHGDPRTHPVDEYLPQKQDFIDRKVNEPELIRLAGEYDIWDHRDPDAKSLQFGLRALSPEDFEALINAQFNNDGSEFGRGMAFILLRKAIVNGAGIKAYTDKVNAEYANQFAYPVDFEGLTFCALNGSGRNSDAVQPAATVHDALLSWRLTPTGVAISLYHALGHEHQDLSVIAKKYGGGGHRGACGFRCTMEQFLQLGLHKPKSVIPKSV